MKYLIVLEPTATGFAAYSPDLDGCVAAGSDRSETIALMREAIASHVGGLVEAGRAVPAPASEPAFVEIPEAIASPSVRHPRGLAAPASGVGSRDRLGSLDGSVLRYDDPFGPATAEDEWEACR